MLEYVALLQTDFFAAGVQGVRDLVDWLAGISPAWYLLGVVILILLIRVLTGKRS